MVWSRIGLLVVGQACASESGVLMQSQAEYNHALLLASDEHSKAGATNVLKAKGNRISKIEDNAKQMADSYGALLKKIVDTNSLVDPATGTPYTPPPAVMNVLKDTFQGLEDELGVERNTNQGLMDAAYDHVVQCNTAKATAFTKDGGVDALKAIANSHRGTHSQCRDDEIADENDKATKCGTFDGLVATCQTDYTYFTAHEKNVNQDDANSLTNVLAAASACEGAVNTLAATAADCDSKQSTFETHFCAYSNALESACNLYTNCRTNALTDWGAVNGSVHELEKSQKTVLKMLKKVMCYINALASATPDNMPTKATIETCSGLGTTAENAIDTSSLDITYKPTPDAEVCDTSPISHKPGSGNFQTTEYDHARYTDRIEASRATC